ncbi:MULTISPECIES: methyltransferase domain-containing protein [unclassified Paenibacillus]|uniref:methyltransferase domain-containing protein n=1 Tax=unclassified Paenibacillus TaxID=185978 RepID=UPI000CFD8643|nr:MULTISPECIES: methyltransferase domain-containing protein [unclassified Paenibacillus]PRA09502.1 methyltransferase [Paenibacillus sp. MYb63]PRA46256.1 methyltransferase [Paenibacillus sp. MYb67]QZN73730.1 class I SAM-dependent methyltransferase [Paenibacillus sp. DR312]
MSEYYWDDQIEYLRNTRWLYYNDDYLEFLVQRVWNIENSVDIIDYGCGYGYLGLKLLPLLPEGSTYTGLDRGKELITQVKEIFSKSSYQTTFIVDDIETVQVKRQYDIAISHAFLLHTTEPITILQKMIESLVDEGRMICFEPHWIANMSNYELHGLEQSKIVQLGVLQKLFEEDTKRNGKDGNIGMKIPILLSQLGLRNVECRVSDKVNFLDQHMADSDKEKLFHALKEEGLGQEPNDRHEGVTHLMERGLNSEEANREYEAESVFARKFNENSWLTYAPNMKITSGIVTR